MDKHVCIKNNYLFIQMPREVDHYKSEIIRQEADELLKDPKVEHIVFDFANTDFMDSSGIGVIVGRYQKIACFGGRVIAIHASERIKRIILMSGMQRFIEISETEYTV